MAAREDQAIATGWPAEQPFPTDLLRQLIHRHAPVIHFHSEEVYYPAKVEWYLARAQLIDGRTGAVLKQHPAPGDLPPGPPDPGAPEANWLTLDPDMAGPALEPHLSPPGDPRRGSLTDACAYVRAVHHPALGATDLQFWMFYPFDGPGLIRLRPFAFSARRCDELLSLWPGGMHEADWELAVVRIDHATLQPCAAFLSQHNSGDAHVGDAALAALERDGDGRIQLYSSLYGHATYAHADERKLFYLWRSIRLFGLELAVVDRIDRAASWNLGQAGNTCLISTSWNDPQVPEPGWLAYGWRWGSYAPRSGRFTRALIDAVTQLAETRMASLVLILYVITMGLFALLLALASRLLGGSTGARLLGPMADNSGPIGPRWQAHKWNGDYGFTGPPQPRDWREAGPDLAQRLAEICDSVCRPPVWLLGKTLRFIVGPLLPRN